MNQTRIIPQHHSQKTLLIREVADQIWDKIKRNAESKIESHEQINFVIGWSTGGLAVYEMAKSKKDGLKAVVLITPGTNLKFVLCISAKTLNGNQKFKHVEQVRPNVTALIPKFTAHLLKTAKKSQDWEVPQSVAGLLLLSDPDHDSYVDIKKVEYTFERNAKHFEVIRYPGAAHEIDNESVDKRTNDKGNKLEDSVVKFLDKNIL